MENKIEKILNKNIYLIATFGYSLLIWCMRFLVSDTQLLFQIVLFMLIPIGLVWFLQLLILKNSLYTIPLLFSIFFSIGVGGTDLSLETLNHLVIGSITVILLFSGIIVFLVKNKVKIKLNTLGFALLLVVVSFFIPFVYNDFSIDAFLISSIAILFLSFYLFYSNTLKISSTEYIYRILLILGIMLSLQLFILVNYYIYNYPGSINDGIRMLLNNGFPVDSPGWGNVNDLTIILLLCSSPLIYYIVVKKYNIFPWLLLTWYSILTFLVLSRGSMITFTLLCIGLVIYIFLKKNLKAIKVFLVILIIGCIVIIANINLLIELINGINLSAGSDLSFMLTGRIRLWENAIYLFSRYPIFGSGWYTPLFVLYPDQNRITIYHSTFFHVLATGGVFGLLVLCYFFYKAITLFKRVKPFNIVWPFIIVYILTQAHGLIDNTQYMLIYTLITLVVMSFFEKNNSNLLIATI